MSLRLSLSVRWVAVLMLAAGASLGVFAARALRAGAGEPTAPVLDAAIEGKVRLYVEYYGLDVVQTDRIRRSLQEFDRGTVEIYRTLRAQNPEPFNVLREQADAQVRAVLESAAGRPAR